MSPDVASSILVVYRDAPAALVGPRQVSFLGEIRHCPPADPDVRIVAHMAYYAQLVMTGLMPSPYSDDDAEQFARYALIDGHTLAVHGDESDEALADRFRVPLDQIRKALTEQRDGG